MLQHLHSIPLALLMLLLLTWRPLPLPLPLLLFPCVALQGRRTSADAQFSVSYRLQEFNYEHAVVFAQVLLDGEAGAVHFTNPPKLFRFRKLFLPPSSNSAL
jgi:hypothetical protein